MATIPVRVLLNLAEEGPLSADATGWLFGAEGRVTPERAALLEAEAVRFEYRAGTLSRALAGPALPEAETRMLREARGRHERRAERLRERLRGRREPRW